MLRLSLAAALLVSMTGAAMADPISALILTTIGISTAAGTAGALAVTLTTFALTTLGSIALTEGGGTIVRLDQ